MSDEIITDHPAAPTLLGRDQILAVNDFEYELVEVPEWGGTVRIRGLSGSERDQLEASMIRARGRTTEVNVSALSTFRARLVAMSIVDDQGRRVFKDTDIDALGKKSSKALQRVFNACQKLSAFTDEDIQELTEELAEDPTDGSSSD